MNIRKALPQDIDQLVRMRWNFTNEDYPEVKADYDAFYTECRAFLEEALQGNRWSIWLAEVDGVIISHIFVQFIQKVPRPGRVTHPFAYMTNVYTLPEYRGQGIGSRIMQTIEQWGRDMLLEFIIVWPADDSVHFYEKNGYKLCTEPMELKLSID
jgi:GNAT superfamily N-acetyltransferase